VGRCDLEQRKNEFDGLKKEFKHLKMEDLEELPQRPYKAEHDGVHFKRKRKGDDDMWEKCFIFGKKDGSRQVKR
tara:strand:- start:514 stop:735 length:222 start_codon:yes stop_codon:yes gene_type:complete